MVNKPVKKKMWPIPKVINPNAVYKVSLLKIINFKSKKISPNKPKNSPSKINVANNVLGLFDTKKASNAVKINIKDTSPLKTTATTLLCITLKIRNTQSKANPRQRGINQNIILNYYNKKAVRMDDYFIFVLIRI